MGNVMDLLIKSNPWYLLDSWLSSIKKKNQEKLDAYEAFVSEWSYGILEMIIYGLIGILFLIAGLWLFLT